MRTLFILLTSIAPNLKIAGLGSKFTIVDSKPIFELPPSRMNLILLPNSSSTSFFETALTFVEIFALGAARGKSSSLSNFLVNECFGNLTASVFFLFVTFFDILFLLLSFSIKVIGPGQNFLYSLIKF